MTKQSEKCARLNAGTAGPPETCDSCLDMPGFVVQQIFSRSRLSRGFEPRTRFQVARPSRRFTTLSARFRKKLLDSEIETRNKKFNFLITSFLSRFH